MGREPGKDAIAVRLVALGGRRWVRLLAAALSGALLALTLPPVDLLPAVAGYSVLVGVLVASETARRPWLDRAMVGAVFGFSTHLGGLWWVGVAFTVDAQTFGPLLPLGVVGLPLLLVPFHALAAVLAGFAPARIVPTALALALALGVTEGLRGLLFTGFPWNVAGYHLTPSGLLSQSAALVGVNGLAVPAVLIGALPAVLLARGGRTCAIAIVGLAVAMVAFGAVWRASAPAPPGDAPVVRIVQPSIPQRDKWRPELRQAIYARLLGLTAQGPDYDIVVWPETSIPFLYTSPSLQSQELAAALKPGATLFAGAVMVEGDGEGRRAYNTILMIDHNGDVVERYDKVRLVPFGEYLPLSDVLSRLGLTALVEGASDFRAGAAATTLTVPGLPPAQPMICYEVIFPHFTAGEAAWIVNVTNDAWFGNTPGPRQHLRHAALRAIERGVPVVRAANTGISAMIDANGRIVERLSLNTVGYLDSPLPASRATLYGLWGDGPMLIIAIGGLAFLWRRRIRESRSGPHNR
ncbi:MAG: apolipoprotein N-acyltransferase [Pseudomonadota bacterium]